MVGWGILGEQRAYLAVALVYIGVGTAAALAGLPIRFSLYHPAMLLSLNVVVCVYLLWRVWLLMVTPGVGRPTRRLYHDLKAEVTWERVLRPVPVLILMPSVLSIYTSWKVMIPEVTPMAWDPWLADVDRLIHGGDVWVLLQPLLGYRLVSIALAGVYAAWFWVFPIVLVWQATGRSASREQFLVSWVVIWGVVGTAGALSFASVGPVYFGRLHGAPDPFAGLYAYVHALPEWVTRAQDGLWDAFARGDLAEFGKGISAMPSLHVAVATLNAIAAWRCVRWIGGVLGVYAILVAVASVHLGWHYAIDAYAGAAAAVAIWHVVGVVLNRMPRRSTVAVT